MAKWDQLQELLETLVPPGGKVYFQPPETVKLIYPCIIFTRISVGTKFANDKPYKFVKRYKVTVIDKSPDSEISEKVSELPLCSFDRGYTANNLYHDVFNIYF